MLKTTADNLVCDTDIAFVLNHPIHLDARKRKPDSKRSVMRDIRVRGFSPVTDGRILMTAADGCVIDRVSLDGVHLRYPLYCDPAIAAPEATSAQCSRHSSEEPGYNAIRFKPRPGGSISEASASRATKYGMASIAWKQTDTGLHLDLQVPDGCTAILGLPGRETETMGAGSHSLWI